MQNSGGGLPHKGKFLDLRGPPLSRPIQKQRSSHPAFQLVAGKTMLPLELQLKVKRLQQGEPRYQEPETLIWSAQEPPWLAHPFGFLTHPWRTLKSWLKSFRARFSWQVPLIGRLGLQVKLSYLGAAVFAALLVPGLMVLSQGLQVRDNLLSLSFSALTNLSQAGSSLKNRSIAQAASDFRSAYWAFFQAGAQVESLGKLTLSIAENAPLLSEKIGLAQSLINLGKNVSLLGESLARAMADFQALGLAGNLAPETSRAITPLLRDIQKHLQSSSQALTQAQANLSGIDVSVLPSSMAKQLQAFQRNLPFFETAARQGSQFLEFLLGVLGEDNPQKYLILFQNNSELRPGGGFIGSLAELNVFEGKVTNLAVSGVYERDGQLQEKVIPPRPLQRITPNWGLRDSNWFLDFALDAQLAGWFYEKAGGGTPDGIFALTPTVIEEILEITGPIDFPQYQMTLNSNNFRPLIQEHTEFEYDRGVNRPKKILADFTPLFLEKIAALPQEKFAQVLKILVEGLESKQILMWFKDKDLQSYVQKQGWAGRVQESPQDYLAVVHSNIAGYKTDKVIEDKIAYQLELTDQGRLKATLKITRRHNGASSPYIFYNYQNRDYIKVYVPKGSELLDAHGAVIRAYWSRVDYDKEAGWLKLPELAKFRETFKIDPQTGTHIFTESGKTVFANWLFTEPGQGSTLILEYLLPFDFSASGIQTYSLLVQKQPGAKPATLIVNFQGQNLSPVWGYPEGLNTSSSGFSYIGSLTSDKFLGFSFGR